MALTLTAIINSKAADCASLNFSDTTSNYGVGGNPQYTDVASVKFDLYDGTGSTLLGSYIPLGWTPYPSNAIQLFSNEFGVGDIFANGTYIIRYTITLNDATTYTCDTAQFTFQCGAALCNTTLNHILMASMSGVTYPTTINNVKIFGNTYTPSTPIAVSSLADVATKLTTYLATLTSLPQEVKFNTFSVVGSTIEFQNPYYSGLSDYSVTLNATTYAGASNSNTNVQVKQQITFDYNCTTKVLSIIDNSGLWNGNTFPQFADINEPITVSLYQVGNGTPIATKSLSEVQFESYINNGVVFTDWFPSITLAPCVLYSLNVDVELLNNDEIYCYNPQFQISYCGALKETGTVVKAQLHISSDCSKMNICDVTGDYDATYNPSGYGIPNVLYEEIVRTEFIIGLIDGTTKTIESEFVPSEYGNNCASFSLTDLYGSDTIYKTIPDYVYPITYNVYGDCDELLGTYSFNGFFGCNFKSCLDARSQETSGCTNCDNDEIQSILLGYADYMRMSAVAVTQPQCASNQLSQAYKQCITKCSTCS